MVDEVLRGSTLRSYLPRSTPPFGLLYGRRDLDTFHVCVGVDYQFALRTWAALDIYRCPMYSSGKWSPDVLTYRSLTKQKILVCSMADRRWYGYRLGVCVVLRFHLPGEEPPTLTAEEVSRRSSIRTQTTVSKIETYIASPTQL